jgi:hypothetical protein
MCLGIIDQELFPRELVVLNDLLSWQGSSDLLTDGTHKQGFRPLSLLVLPEAGGREIRLLFLASLLIKASARIA